jgi:hypothetical protein
MSRGFDLFHRAFMIDDSPSERNLVAMHFSDAEEVTFQPDAARLLAGNPWLQMREAPRYAHRNAVSYSW